MYVIDPGGEREEGGGWRLLTAAVSYRRTAGGSAEGKGKRTKGEKSGASQPDAGRGDAEARSQTNDKPIDANGTDKKRIHIENRAQRPFATTKSSNKRPTSMRSHHNEKIVEREKMRQKDV
jgi:hypothetical protein